MNLKFSTIKIAVGALMMAIIFVVTMFVMIPIPPIGYANLGTLIIMLTAYFLGGEIAIISAGLGSMLADLALGVPVWMPFTFVIKSVMVIILILFVSVAKKKQVKILSFRVIAGSVVLLLWQVAGYMIAGAIISGSVEAGLVTGIGLLFEALVNLIIFLVIGTIMEKSGVSKYLKL